MVFQNTNNFMQIYTSKSLEGLDFQSKYNLSNYTNKHKDLYIFGMYRNEDYQTLVNHKGNATVIWQGMDAKTCLHQWVDKLRTVKNIAISHWISDSLNKLSIRHELKAISATKVDSYINEPLGDSVYFYSSNGSKESQLLYGENYLEDIRKKTGLNIIRAAWDTYNKQELKEVYKKCFLGLRLTKYDGCPNGVLEMGLMGRKSIFNGNLPHSIKWSNVDDICENILKEYDNRDKNNNYISKDFIKFINENNL